MKQKVTEVVAASLSAVFVGALLSRGKKRERTAPAKVSGWELQTEKLILFHRSWTKSNGCGEDAPPGKFAKYQSALF